MSNIPKQQLRYFTIASKSSGRVLDLCQDGDNKGKLIIYDSWGAQNQQFGIVHVSALEVLLVNRMTGLCLTVANNSDKNGAVIVEEPPNNRPSQRFRLQKISPSSGEYVVFTFSGKALDCCENETKNNTRIIQWDFHAKDNQKWLLTSL
jgi:hypothetical protein